MRADLQGSPVYKAPDSQYLNLANNENFNLAWLDVIGNQMDDIVKGVPFHQYGLTTYEQLTAKYAAYLGVPPEQVLAAPGSDSLIPYLISTLSTQTVVTFEVDFFRYGQFAKTFQRTHIRVPNAAGVDGLIEACKAHNAELVMLSSPNNPLGVAQERDALVKLLDSVNAYVVIDEAYAEYHGESLVDLIGAYPKLLIMRTLSKGWGLARLRVGFLVANEDLIQYISAVRGPFLLSDLNANIAAAVLEHPDLMRESVQKTIATREKFKTFLQGYAVKIYPSGANFVHIEVPDPKAVAAGVLEDGMAIAVMGAKGLRITIGTDAQMADLQNSLAKYLPQAE